MLSLVLPCAGVSSRARACKARHLTEIGTGQVRSLEGHLAWCDDEGRVGSVYTQPIMTQALLTSLLSDPGPLDLCQCTASVSAGVFAASLGG